MRIMPLLFLALFAVASFGAHWTIASWAMRVFPKLAKRRRWFIAITAALVIMTPLARMAARRTRTGFASEASAFAIFELMVVVFSVLPLLLARLASRTAARTREPEKSAHPPPAFVLGRREMIERVGGIAALG